MWILSIGSQQRKEESVNINKQVAETRGPSECSTSPSYHLYPFEQGRGEIGDRGHFRDVLENHRSILRPMLMPWCDICILETSPRYVEYLLDITARMHAEQTFRGRGRNRRNKWKLECRTERWEVERENRNVLLHDEELINVFQPPRVRARSCVVHRAQRHQPTRPTRAENPCGCRWRGHRGYAFALSLSASVCPCVHRSVQQPCLGLFVGEERYRLVKEGNLLLGSLAKSERSWFVRSRPQRSLLRDDSSNQRYS